ncbi:hypothetical protein PJP10_31195, partial [Mycobacterium kansasii]
KTSKRTTNEDSGSEKDDEDEEVALLVQRFRKFFQKNRGRPSRGRKVDNKPSAGKFGKKNQRTTMLCLSEVWTTIY